MKRRDRDRQRDGRTEVGTEIETGTQREAGRQREEKERETEKYGDGGTESPTHDFRSTSNRIYKHIT